MSESNVVPMNENAGEYGIKETSEAVIGAGEFARARLSHNRHYCRAP